jgi:Tfp pilus assembly protein PilO
MTPRHHPALLLAAVAAVLVADWLCIARPRAAVLEAARDLLARHRIELAAARGEVTRRVDTKQAVREAARALRHAARRLPDRRELYALLSEVARSARDARLDLISLRPKTERRATDHVEVPVELQIRGSYARTLAFLRRLEEMDRLVHVGDVTLERQDGPGARVVLRGSCTAVTYRLLDRQDGGGARRDDVTGARG